MVNFAAADGNDRATSIPANIEIACLFYACQLTSAHHESLIHEYTSDDGEKHEIRRPFTCPSTGTNLTKRALVSRLSCARVNPSALSSGWGTRLFVVMDQSRTLIAARGGSSPRRTSTWDLFSTKLPCPHWRWSGCSIRNIREFDSVRPRISFIMHLYNALVTLAITKEKNICKKKTGRKQKVLWNKSWTSPCPKSGYSTCGCTTCVSIQRVAQGLR